MKVLRVSLGIIGFFGFVLAFTFASTFVHEMSHAAAWGDMPEVQFFENREAAEAALAHEEKRTIGHTTYRVQVVEQTTVAMYPQNILVAGLTLGLAPASMMPDPVLGSTFYALDDHHYEHLASGEAVTQWEHSAMPMIVNGFLAIPLIGLLFWKPNALTAAAAWVNAGEWRFNLHHAEEIGIHSGFYLAISVLMMLAMATLVMYKIGSRAPVAVPDAI